MGMLFLLFNSECLALVIGRKYYQNEFCVRCSWLGLPTDVINLICKPFMKMDTLVLCWTDQELKSLAPGWYGSNFRNVIFKLTTSPFEILSF